eukprot:TRINITY_DN7020_c0_g1_i1.p2 TRINITY_DN7020_c0_g1~~TRINITY_DN7020_c0_g1_i1.p2  ORF type:complete len:199 (+),score=41.23 TRINITY_DN7020_c0_g1_i1:209-805(+)
MEDSCQMITMSRRHILNSLRYSRCPKSSSLQDNESNFAISTNRENGYSFKKARQNLYKLNYNISKYKRAQKENPSAATQYKVYTRRSQCSVIHKIPIPLQLSKRQTTKRVASYRDGGEESVVRRKCVPVFRVEHSVRGVKSHSRGSGKEKSKLETTIKSSIKGLLRPSKVKDDAVKRCTLQTTKESEQKMHTDKCVIV